ncbi:MAG: OmpA family protein [Flavobacteriaceae bacterium]|nr:OmpA family protein [Flavobacteriaceae bacterium]
MHSPLQAQEAQYTKPSWKFGVAVGANFNFYQGSTHELSTTFTPPVVFNDGNGVGLYLAPLIEFQRPDSRFGFMLQAGYDSRKGAFDQKETACNCPADLSTDLSYITVEPSLRLAPFKSNFYLYGGPRFAFNLDKSFTYEQGINPAFPNQIANPDVEGDFSNVEKTIISMQVGAGLDIPLSSQNNKTQFVLSPFVSFQPYFGQDPRSIETWNLTTVRAGVVLKFGQGRKIQEQEEEVVVVYKEPKVEFTVDAPGNVPTERRVREMFPLRNYIFFTIGSTEIPSRYKLLKKEEVKSFRADQLETALPLTQSGRSARQMNVYYNVINILGDRMVKYPLTTINLVGSSENGPEDGKKMAESVKVYLVNVFGINASRIGVKGQFKPDTASETSGKTRELELLLEGDRRVSIESSSPDLLMEFQSGPNSLLKPMEIVAIQEAPVDSYVIFNVKGADEAFTSWSLQLTDSDGISQNFGPYTQESISMPGKSILGTRPEDTYKVTMTGQTKNGTVIVKETTTHMVLWTPSEIEEGLRFSIIFEFDESKATSIYKKYLTEVVTPKIPKNGTVIIHGHTDIIGDLSYNQKLSVKRANEVKSIIEKSLAKSGRSDVKFEIRGFGEDENVSPFDNKLPEERSYNRTVIIDIIPIKN